MSLGALGATRPHVFHVDLSDASPDYDYVVIAPGQEQPLLAHTEETKQTLLGAKSVGDVVDVERFAATTHFTATAVMMPVAQTYRVHVKAIPHDPSRPSFAHAAAICVPDDALAENETSNQTIDWVSTAQTFIFHHPDLQTPDRDVSAVVMEHLSHRTHRSNYQRIERLALAMRRAGMPTTDPKKGWATLVPVRDEEGNPIQEDGETLYMQEPTPFIQEQAAAAMSAVLTSAQNDLRLMDKKWMFTEGVSTQDDAMNTPRFAAGVRVGGDAAGWKATVDQINRVNGMAVSVEVLDPAERRVRLTIRNYYIRYLGAYIQFLDADMRPMNTPRWTPDGGPSSLGRQYDNFRALGPIDPVHTIMGIPRLSPPGGPGELVVNVTFPHGAVAAGVFGCGVGTGARPYPQANMYGVVMTGVANFAIPTFLLGFGFAAQTYKPLYDILQKPEIIIGVLGLAANYFSYGFSREATTHGRMDWKLLSRLIQLIFSPLLVAVLKWVQVQIIGAKLRNGIPFVGWASIALSVISTMAQIATTIKQTSESPWDIPNRISTTIDSSVTILPDPRLGAFPHAPEGKASCIVSMIFRSNRPTVRKRIADFTGPNLRTEFTNQLGGTVKFEVSFYAGERLAATASTGWLDNDQQNTANVSLVLMGNPVELDEESIYAHAQILGYRNGAYEWMPSDHAPTSTLADRDSRSSGNAISVWQGLTLSQRHALLGWAWKAAGLGIPSTGGTTGTQLFGMQTIDIPGRPVERAMFPAAGFDSPNNIVFDPYPPKFLMRNGQWVLVDGRPVPDPADVDLGSYWVDPRKAEQEVDAGGGYHLRKVDRGFDIAGDQPSHGRFPWAPDSLVIHPSGHVVAINTQYAKIMVLRLPATGRPDNLTPVAETFAGRGMNVNGSGGRKGLLVNPVAVTCTYDGTILILERSTEAALRVARIQAFDLNGNPVNAFKDSAGGPSPFLQIDPTVTYLDLTCSGNQDLGHVHVLSHRNGGRSPGDYAMTVYQFGENASSKNPLVTTTAMSAARIVTDMWHSIYALNWEMTTDGRHRAGPTTGPGAGRTVPSISLWLPPSKA